MSDRSDDDGGGCCAFVLVILAIALVVMALISLAAIVDPFSWLPPVGEIWKDCEGDCALAHRFPGFWLHVVVNLAYFVAVAVLVLALFGLALELREARAGRFDSSEAAGLYTEKRRAFAWLLALGLLCGAGPIAVAITWTT